MDLDPILVELYSAVDNDLKILATIGIRTAFDVASHLIGVDDRLTFSEKLNALVAGNHISKNDFARLEVLTEGGNASAHRGWVPNGNQLDTLMGILEHFIHDVFISPHRKRLLDKEILKVKSLIPPRPKR